MTEALELLQSSAARLRELVEPLDVAQLGTQAYPSEWTIAQVLSHIGSGAVIMKQVVDDAVTNTAPDPAFAPSVWDAWNAKSPEAQAADALAADDALVERFAALDDPAGEPFSISMGPMTLDLAGLVTMRLNEHTLHTWDVEVALDPAATLPVAETTAVIDNLEMIARFSGKPTGTEHRVRVDTTEPRRRFAVDVGAETVVLTPADDGDDAPDLVLPGEAFVRLVYGRLDPAHTPPNEHTEKVDELRRAFRGV